MSGTSSILQAGRPEGSPTVRFASANEEIEPKPLESDAAPQQISEQEEQSVKELSQTLQSSDLQERRMCHFAFEPFSLPASRVRSVSRKSSSALLASTARARGNGQGPDDFRSEMALGATGRRSRGFPGALPVSSSNV